MSCFQGFTQQRVLQTFRFWLHLTQWTEHCKGTFTVLALRTSWEIGAVPPSSAVRASDHVLLPQKALQWM